MGLLDALYRVVMRRNAVYVTFVVAGAFAGERVRPPPPSPIHASQIGPPAESLIPSPIHISQIGPSLPSNLVFLLRFSLDVSRLFI
jgi:hypothetical protein